MDPEIDAMTIISKKTKKAALLSDGIIDGIHQFREVERCQQPHFNAEGICLSCGHSQEEHTSK